MDLFARAGWARTTVVAIAEAAGVAVETVYSGFGSKKGLLRAAMDVAIVGDAEPVPLVEREAYLRLRTEPPQRRLEGAIEIAGRIYSGPVSRLWAALLEAGASDSEVAQWCTQLEAGRRTTIAEVLELVYGRQSDQRTVDIVWSLISIETYTKLCLDRGWTTEQWQEWAIEAIHLFAGRP
ncbi:TetR/AcrR family transcriptional regulator [Amycolatopsis sp. NPDC058278]|uniref:TetR/AcrR family transcriptional regulator n=1 Tax=Amycolatopsis sp. NPDC058278 TaxID=3346417 RepID=UPI0036DCD27C